MSQRIGLAIGIIAALLFTSSAFAQSPTIPFPASSSRINFYPGTTEFTVATNLAQGVSQGFVLGVQAQQSIYVTQSGGALVQVLDPQNNVVAPPTRAPGPWAFAPTQGGDYTVVLYGQGRVTLSLYVPPPGQVAPPDAPLPSYIAPIYFHPGSTSYSFGQNLWQGIPVAYALGVSAGQTVKVAVLSGVATVTLLGSNGRALPPTTPQPGWRFFAITQTDNYVLDLLGTGYVNISINIPPLAGVPPPPPPIPQPHNAQRITFAPGTDSFTVNTTLVQGVPQSYVLGIAAGQTLYVAASGSVSGILAFDPQGNSLSPTPTPYGAIGFSIPRTGDYTIIVAGQGQVSIGLYIPPLPDWY